MYRPIAAATIALGLAAGACSSDPPSVSKWVDGLCSALVTWTGAVEAAAQSAVENGPSKTALQGSLSAAKTATTKLRADINKLGKPKVDGGDKAKESLDQLSTQLDSSVQTISGAVDAVGGVADLPKAAATVKTALGSMRDQVSSTLTTVQQVDAGGQVKTAFEKSATCGKLRIGSSG